MAEAWFALSLKDQAEALEVAAGRSGRPAHLLEEDIWVVWALGVIYRSPQANTLTFKGGTSLSKVYQVIDRFSEGIDLTYDTRNSVAAPVSRRMQETHFKEDQIETRTD